MLQLKRALSELILFSPTTIEELENFLGASAIKSCMLDPIPAKIFKSCFSVLLPIIKKIVNKSLAHAVVPVKFKEAALTPILKKQSQDHELFLNFRPISNLRFVSKVVEKVVAARLISHVNNNNLNELFQSAYKEGHSTETALIRVQNDILRVIDNHECVILLLLDLSAAFDTVNHTILLQRLSCCFGIKEKALAWISSYLCERTQFVCIENKCSTNRDLSCEI